MYIDNAISVPNRLLRIRKIDLATAYLSYLESFMPKRFPSNAPKKKPGDRPGCQKIVH